MNDRAMSSPAIQMQEAHDLNIFILHEDPYLAAGYHCNSHVNKMRSEGVLMLSTCNRVLINLHGKNNDDRYKAVLKDACALAYPAHPCTRWVMEHSMNYVWLWKLVRALNNEHKLRFGDKGTLATEKRLYGSLQTVIDLFPDNRGTGWQDPATVRGSWGTVPSLAMPGHCLKYNPDNTIDPVESYREYYRKEKTKLHKWSPVDRPNWI